MIKAQPSEFEKTLASLGIHKEQLSKNMAIIGKNFVQIATEDSYIRCPIQNVTYWVKIQDIVIKGIPTEIEFSICDANIFINNTFTTDHNTIWIKIAIDKIKSIQYIRSVFSSELMTEDERIKYFGEFAYFRNEMPFETIANLFGNTEDVP